MSAVNLNALGATTVARAARLVIGLAAAPFYERALGAATVVRANEIYGDLMAAAKAGGFTESVLIFYAVSRRHDDWGEKLAAEVVECISGPDKFFALLDLSTTPTDWIGFEQ